MENIDLKTIIYFALAILWLLFNSFRKSKKSTGKQPEALPPLKDMEIKEILKEKAAVSQKHRRELNRKEIVSKLKNKKEPAENPTEERSFYSVNEVSSEEEYSYNILTDFDPKDMVIYSEILKRPEY